MWKQDMPRRRVSVPQVQQRLPLRPYRKTSNILCDGHRLYNHISQFICSIVVQPNHSTTCSILACVTDIPYLGRRWLSTLTLSVVLKMHKPDNQTNQGKRSPITSNQGNKYKHSKASNQNTQTPTTQQQDPYLVPITRPNKNPNTF